MSHRRPRFAHLAAMLLLASPLLAQDDGASVFAYARSMSGTYLMTGGDQERVSYAHGDYIQPRIVPGDGRLLINSRRDGTTAIWLLGPGEGDALRICEGNQVSPSAGGAAIVFRRDGAIVTHDLTTGAEAIVSPDGWDECSHPSFCPDGRVLFVSPDVGSDGIYLADPADPESPETLFHAEADSAPRCSPDGQVIAYQHGAHIRLHDLATGADRRLTYAGGVQSWPIWSRDGEALAYLQSPSPHDGPSHLYRMALDEPQRVWLTIRDVQGGPDWNGIVGDAAPPAVLPVASVRLRRAEAGTKLPAEASELDGLGGEWATVADGAEDVDGDLLIACSWGGVHLSRATGRATLFSRQDGSLARGAQIRFADDQAREAKAISSVAVHTAGDGDVEVTLSLAVDEGALMSGTLVVSRFRPMIQIQPEDGLAGVVIQEPTQLAIVPDRLGYDLLYVPDDYTTPVVELPRAPFALCAPTDSDGLLMVAAPGPEQRWRLTRGGGPASFSGIAVDCAGESAFVAFLPGDDVFHAAPLNETGGEWNVLWSNPFPAQWRLIARSSQEARCLMARMDTPIRGQEWPVPGTEGLRGVDASGLIYAYGRSQNTPLERAMPTDILWEALGPRGASELLDITGIRGYRRADGPYTDPRVAADIAGWIHNRDRPGAQEKIDDLCEQILSALGALDTREEEFQAFAAAARDAAAGSESAEVRPLVRLIDDGLSSVEAMAPARSVPTIESVAWDVKAFRGDTKAAHRPFASSVTGAVEPRLERLSAFRLLAMRARHAAGLALARAPEDREALERLRRLAGHVLRNREYLEGHWLGEEPLGGPEVHYEDITGK